MSYMAVSPQLSAAATFASSPKVSMGAPVRRSFVLRPGPGHPSPIAALLSSQKTSGGRGGRNRLALLITALWVAAQPPHTIQRPAGWWADMIGLDNPSERAATRSVTQAFRELERRGVITLTRGHHGYPAKVALHNESGVGVGQPYQRPNGSIESYFRIPPAFWVNRPICGVDARGLAMYLILLHYHNENTPDRRTWFSDNAFHARHALGQATRLHGLNQLVNTGIATMIQEVVSVKTNEGYRAVPRRFYALTAPYVPPHTEK